MLLEPVCMDRGLRPYLELCCVCMCVFLFLPQCAIIKAVWVNKASALDPAVLPLFQMRSALSPALPNSSTCVAELSTPPSNANSLLLTEGVTHKECDDGRRLSGKDTISDKTGSVAANVNLALLPW